VAFTRSARGEPLNALSKFYVKQMILGGAGFLRTVVLEGIFVVGCWSRNRMGIFKKCYNLLFLLFIVKQKVEHRYLK
jgi:hypothetical protein